MDLSRRVTLRQLEVFVEAARQPNFSRAAESLHLTQPAVSMQIRQLEETVGLSLFDKAGRGKRLTEAGSRLLVHVSRVLGELHDAEQTLAALKGLAGGSVTVGLVSTAKYFAPKLLAAFSQQHPGVDIQFLVGNRESLISMLGENSIDLAVMGRPPAEVEVLAEPLADNPHVMVSAVDSPLAGNRKIEMRALRDEMFLLREPGSGTRMMMEELLDKYHLEPVRSITLGSNETIKQAVMARLGISLLSLHTLGLELRAGAIALLNVADLPMRRTWYVAHLRKRRLSPAALAFRQFLIDHTQQHLRTSFDGVLEQSSGTRA